MRRHSSVAVSQLNVMKPKSPLAAMMSRRPASSVWQRMVSPAASVAGEAEGEIIARGLFDLPDAAADVLDGVRRIARAHLIAERQPARQVDIDRGGLRQSRCAAVAMIAKATPSPIFFFIINTPLQLPFF